LILEITVYADLKNLVRMGIIFHVKIFEYWQMPYKLDFFFLFFFLFCISFGAQAYSEFITG